MLAIGLKCSRSRAGRRLRDQNQPRGKMGWEAACKILRRLLRGELSLLGDGWIGALAGEEGKSDVRGVAGAANCLPAAGLEKLSLVDPVGPPPSVVRANSDSREATLPVSVRQEELEMCPATDCPTCLIGLRKLSV